MSAENPNPANGQSAAARSARRLLRMARKGTLATLDHRHPGHPYASLVVIATEPDGAPITLISGLAVHTRNLEQDARASVLLEDAAQTDDPLSGGRLSLRGTLRPTASGTALRRFLSRHPGAKAYSSLPDFRMFALEIEGGHYIGGFARIVDLPAAALVTDVSDASRLIEAEADIVAHMNEDHADALSLYATAIANCAPGDWRMTGIDPEGIDLLHRSNSARVEFAAPVTTPGDARHALVALAQQARNTTGV
jgi:putative heme iron utilization protein